MKTKAAPHHRILASILAVSAIGCFIYALVLYPQPLRVLLSMVPLLAVFTVIFVPYYRDHKGIIYDVDDEAITLRKGDRVRKRIPLDSIVSVQNNKGSVILRRHGFWQTPEYLHPASDPDQFMLEIEEKLQHYRFRVQPQDAATKPHIPESNRR